jgi:hypothetical protein
MDELLIAHGGEIKATKDGKIEGYLVRFSTEKDPDLSGDFFTKETDFGIHERLPLYYEHGFDEKLKNQRIGIGLCKKDEVGVWFEAQMDLADEYQKMLYEKGLMTKKFGYSSGAIGHLVAREPARKAYWLKSWPLGEASITPHPAEYRNLVVPVKAYAEGLKSSGLSLDNKRDIVQRALIEKLKADKGEDDYVYAWICDLYDSTVVWNSDDGCYEATYTIDELSATLGTPKRVQRLVSYKPLPGEGKSLTIQEFTERDFERHLREAGLGQKNAAFLSHEYRKLQHQREADADEPISNPADQAWLELLERTLNTGVHL